MAASNPPYRYRAFFSYCRKDRKTADWLWRSLDRFRPPKSLQSLSGKALPARLGPIFRDREEFSSGSGLTSKVLQALRDSESLIVLCSPHAADPERSWVTREVIEFKRLGRGDRIFPVIAAGTPSASLSQRGDAAYRAQECFSPALLHDVEPNGSLSNRPADPGLAADLRNRDEASGEAAGDGRQLGRLKLIAGLLDVRLDDLVKRHESRQRQLLVGFLFAAVVFLVLALGLGFEYFNASSQRLDATSRGLGLNGSVLHEGGDEAQALLVTALSLQIRPSQEARDAMLAMFAGREFMSSAVEVGGGSVDSVVVSKDGSLVVTGSKSGRIARWDARTGQSMGQVVREGSAVNAVALSPDGSLIASGSNDGTVQFWFANSGLASGKPLKGHVGSVASLAFSPDGLRLLSGGVDGSVRQWDLRDRVEAGDPVQGHKGLVRSIVFTPDGRRFATGGYDGYVQFWDAKTLQRLSTRINTEHRSVEGLAISPDGANVVTCGSDKMIRIWAIATPGKALLQLRGHTKAVTGVGYSPDGMRVISASQDKSIRVWDAKSGLPIGQPLRGHASWVTALAVDNTGAGFVSGSADGTIRIWKRDAQHLIGAPVFTSDGGAQVMDISPDDRYIAIGDVDGNLTFWSVGERKPVGSPIKAHDDLVSAVAFSPDGAYLISGGADGTLRLWDARRRTLIGAPWSAHSDKVNGVAFSPDGKRIASSGDDNLVLLWDVDSRTRIGAPIAIAHGVQALLFGRTGDTLVTGSPDGTVQFWNLKHPAPTAEFAGDAGISAIALDKQGRFVAVGDWSGHVRLFDAATYLPTGDVLRSNDEGDWIYSLAFSPDGSQLLGAIEDGTMQRWDVATRRPIGQPLRAHGDVVNRALYTRDGSMIISAGDDDTVRFWSTRYLTSDDALVKLACESSSRNLTSEEWTRYVPSGIVYRRVCGELPVPQVAVSAPSR